jgi:hypothetical protein
MFNLDFHPNTVVANSKQAKHFATKQVWPLIHVVGCRFNLSQAWWRNIQITSPELQVRILLTMHTYIDEFLIGNCSYFTNIIILQTKYLFI